MNAYTKHLAHQRNASPVPALGSDSREHPNPARPFSWKRLRRTRFPVAPPPDFLFSNGKPQPKYLEHRGGKKLISRVFKKACPASAGRQTIRHPRKDNNAILCDAAADLTTTFLEDPQG